MNRRMLLAGACIPLSSLVAGCLNLNELLRPGQSELELSLTDIARVGEAHPLHLDVNLRSSAMGDEAMPDLAIALENLAEEPLFIGYTGSWPEDALLPSRDSNPPALRLLANREVSDLTVTMEECPTTKYRPTRTGGSTGHRVPPMTQYHIQYFVVGSAQNPADGCPPAGHYRFNSRYSYTTVFEVEESGWENADKREFSWGFSLSVVDKTD